MDRFDALKELIEAHPAIVEFADFGDGISEKWILKAEAAIGLPLPKTYKWWLRNYSGGEIGGEEIFSVYEEDCTSVIGGDIVYMYRQGLREANSRKDRIPVCHSDIDGVFCFDASQGLHANEYPVLSEATGTHYARDFLEFLEKRIALF
ncbi:MAG: SMI1/KNR4 family protein [Patescibacteria group bacterium]|nr:SMI1/KNR4 family protein [Patescibacteria group bacterium]